MTVVNYDHEGREYYNQLEIISVFNEQGEHTNFIALQKDITAEKLTQQEMIRMNTRFELIARHSKIGTWEFLPADGSIRWSDLMYEIYGASKDLSKAIPEIWKNAMDTADYEQGVEDMNRIRNGQLNKSESMYRIRRQSDGMERMV